MKRTINGRNALRPGSNHPSANHWEELRAIVMERQGGRCATCPNEDGGSYRLELHHRHYDNWGKELPEDVVLLCSLCHEYITSRFRATDEYIVEAGIQPAPRPGLPTVEIHEASLPQGGASTGLRPGLPTSSSSEPVSPAPSAVQPRTRPF